MIRIQFIDVGHQKDCWEEDFVKLDGRAILKSAKKRARLVSRDVEVCFSDETLTAGWITAGMHTVGTFRVVQL